MIKNIIFDFGDIFINLDKEASIKALKTVGFTTLTDEMNQMNQAYEVGRLSTAEFVDFYHAKLPHTSKTFLIDAWNAILLDFPLHRLDFIENLAKSAKYRLFLLSNTNDLHISWIMNDWKMPLYNRFKACFEQFYLSHEIELRKPNADIYEFVLQENNLNAEETLFIDDTKENTDGAASLGIHTWHLIPGQDDVVDLFTKKHDLF